MLYLWLKAFHVISMVCWFAALFYLPRLFVYHAMSDDTVSQERFCVMERKLYRGIMTPAMVLTVLFGIALLAINPALFATGGWLHAKLTLVALLIAYHFVCGAQRKAFAEGRNRRGHVFYRWFNEIPVVLLLGIVILVIVKPF